MLYDKRWDAKLRDAEADPLTLESLIAWLEKQPAETSYDWQDCEGHCLIGRYFTAMGMGEFVPYERVFSNILDDYGDVCSSLSGPTTYGAALERARAVMAKRRR